MLCKGCGREIDGSKKFCMYCGAEVEQAAAGGPPPPPPGVTATPAPTPPAVAPPGAVPAPGGTPYQVPYTARRPLPSTASSAAVRTRTGGGGSPVAGALTMIAGAAVLASTFLSWLTAGGFASGSGWEILTSSAEGGNFVYRYGGGILFLSGFWSLLVGALLLVAGAVMLFKGRVGGGMAVLFSVVGLGAAALNVIMIYSKFRGEFGLISPGYGLWIFAGASVCALVFGMMGLSRSG